MFTEKNVLNFKEKLLHEGNIEEEKNRLNETLFKNILQNFTYAMRLKAL